MGTFVICESTTLLWGNTMNRNPHEGSKGWAAVEDGLAEAGILSWRVLPNFHCSTVTSLQ